MIACLYGEAAAPFVAPVVADLTRAAARRHTEIVPIAVESAVAAPHRGEDVERLYVLPFDIPPRLPPALPTTAGALLKTLFPRAQIVNSTATHELCWDKTAVTLRLLGRGVPIPETLIADSPEEARNFIRRHGQAILKEPRSCSGHGHLVVLNDGRGTIAGEAAGRRYAVELQPTGSGRRLSHGVLSCSPPFFLQRLITGVKRGGGLEPAQILRAYIVDGQVVFWTERYREKVRRPSDFIISAVFGARYRFQPAVSDAGHKTARRAAEALGVLHGAVDLIRTGSEGPYVLGADTDGQNMMIDRGFKQTPDFRPAFDFDDFLAQALTAKTPEPAPERAGRKTPPPITSPGV